MNSYYKASIIAWIFAVLLLIGIFLPESFGIDGMDGGFALSFASFFLSICAVITAVVCGKYGKAYHAIMGGENLIAHWFYDTESFRKFADKEYQRQKNEKQVLFYIVAAWSVFFAIVFPIFDFENGIWVSVVMGGLIVIIGFTAWMSILWAKRVLKRPGEAYISKNGVILNRQLHCFSGPFTVLHGVNLKKDHKENYLQFDYQAGQEIHQYTVRVPVPDGKQKEAEQVLAEFREA